MKYIVTLNGKNYEVEVTETEAVIKGVTEAVTAPLTAVPEPVAAPAAADGPVETGKTESSGTATAQTAKGQVISAPMPGTVLAVKVNIGHPVKAGDVLFVLEAMKMENDIVAPADGTVKQILVSKGDSVNTEDVLAVI